MANVRSMAATVVCLYVVCVLYFYRLTMRIDIDNILNSPDSNAYGLRSNAYYKHLESVKKGFRGQSSSNKEVEFDKDDVIENNKNLYESRRLYAFPSNCVNRARELQTLTGTSCYTIDFSLFLYNAFLDNRTGENMVRIIAVMHSRVPKPRIWCHFRNSITEESSYVTSSTEFYEMNENHKFTFGGWIFSCRVPQGLLPCEVFVSKYEMHDHRAVQLPLLSIKPKYIPKMRINVCVSPLFGNVSYARLIEFIELGRLMGADHFTFYTFDVSRIITEILQHYIRLNVVTVLPWILPVPPALIWYNGQVISINDCLYRSMPFFSHVAFIDLDEMVVPRNSLFNWKEILTSSNNSQVAGYSFLSANFPIQNDIQNLPGRTPLLTLLTTNRSTALIGTRSKVIVMPYRVFEMGIHHVSRPWPDERNYTVIKVHPLTALLNHYITGHCKPSPCTQFVTDRTVPQKYAKALKKSFKYILRNIFPHIP